MRMTAIAISELPVEERAVVLGRFDFLWSLISVFAVLLPPLTRPAELRAKLE